MLHNLRTIKNALAIIERLNNDDIDELEFHVDGTPVEFPDEDRKDWNFIGLSNAELTKQSGLLCNVPDWQSRYKSTKE